MISIRGLSFTFAGADRKALDGVSLEIPDGQFLAITGPSGCGKSTLALAMGGYIPHVFGGRLEGSVAVDGRCTADAELSDIAPRVAVVQQDPESQLCTLAVWDEVAFGPENLCLDVDEVARRVDEALAMAGASHLKDRDVYALSGGEKQRVAIASMLAMHPRALILDEPTSNLDPSSTAAVLEAVGRLKAKAGMTIVVVEHKLDRLMGMADRLVVMDSGRIALDGPPRQVVDRYRDRLSSIGIRPPGLACPACAASGPPAENGPIVVVEALHASYGGREALRGIDLRVDHSEIVGIVGPNGAGKTTLLNVLMGLHRHDAGRVSVLGLDAGRARTSDIARRAGFIFQNPNHQIFEKTVYGEAAFACRNFGMGESEAAGRVNPVLEAYGLAVYRDRHPLGISFGEKRRLNLCSVLPHDPELILMDEPFVGQDYANVTRMCGELRRLRDGGKAIVIVSHDIDMVYRYCDRIVLLRDGLILVDGSPAVAMGRIRALGMADYVPESCRT